MTPSLNPIERHRRRCREARARMSELLDGELDDRAAAKVARHARWCPNCRRMLKSLKRTAGGLQALSREPTPADEPRPRR